MYLVRRASKRKFTCNVRVCGKIWIAQCLIRVNVPTFHSFVCFAITVAFAILPLFVADCFFFAFRFDYLFSQFTVCLVCSVAFAPVLAWFCLLVVVVVAVLLVLFFPVANIFRCKIYSYAAMCTKHKHTRKHQHSTHFPSSILVFVFTFFLHGCVFCFALWMRAGNSSILNFVVLCFLFNFSSNYFASSCCCCFCFFFNLLFFSLLQTCWLYAVYCIYIIYLCDMWKSRVDSSLK